MTTQQFGDATHYVQRTILKMHGICLLKRKTSSFTAFLYQVDDFYVEVIKSDLPNQTPLIKSFSVSANSLGDYLCMVDLSFIHYLLE